MNKEHTFKAPLLAPYKWEKIGINLLLVVQTKTDLNIWSTPFTRRGFIGYVIMNVSPYIIIVISSAYPGSYYKSCSNFQ